MAGTVAPARNIVARAWIGAVNLAAVLVSVIWFRDYFISVWCYFAAVISVLVVWVVYGLNRR